MNDGGKLTEKRVALTTVKKTIGETHTVKPLFNELLGD
jgi:hypothetical protein